MFGVRGYAEDRHRSGSKPKEAFVVDRFWVRIPAECNCMMTIEDLMMS